FIIILRLSNFRAAKAPAVLSQTASAPTRDQSRPVGRVVATPSARARRNRRAALCATSRRLSVAQRARTDRGVARADQTELSRAVLDAPTQRAPRHHAQILSARRAIRPSREASQRKTD